MGVCPHSPLGIHMWNLGGISGGVGGWVESFDMAVFLWPDGPISCDFLRGARVIDTQRASW